MKRAIVVIQLRSLLCLVAALPAAQIAMAANAAAVKAQFLNPPRQYSAAPFCVWNDMLTDEQVKGRLLDLASQQGEAGDWCTPGRD